MSRRVFDFESRNVGTTCAFSAGTEIISNFSKVPSVRQYGAIVLVAEMIVKWNRAM